MSPKKDFPNARKMGIEIHKFGGASLADAAAFRRVVEIVKTRTAPRIVVVSAPAGVTDALLGLAKQAAAVRARYVDATEVIFTDGPFGGASPNLMLTDMAARKVLRPLCAAGLTPVIPGFIGAAKIDDRDGDHEHGHDRRALGVATLGRG